MEFPTEPSGYQRGILSDLQGAWAVLRDSIIESTGFDGVDRALLHIDEANSWEVVRRLEHMPPLLLLVRNICTQGNAPDEVLQNLEILSELMDEVQADIRSGKEL
jgi:hypothetical protein